MKRAVVFQSFCSFGRASLTNLIPALSAMGTQVCPVPTAVLSTHLGYPGAPVNDLSVQCAATVDHWTALGLRFDAVLTGFLSSPAQAETALRCAETLLQPEGLLVVDPVMGDHGRLYRSVTAEQTAAVRALCHRAAVITPNLTEAAVLLGLPAETRPESGTELRRWLEELSAGRRTVILTGYEEEDRLGAAVQTPEGAFDRALAPKIPAAVHGVGDLFSAVLLGGLLRGEPAVQAARRACAFCSRAVEAFAAAGTPEPEGVPLEALLGELMG